MQCEPNRVVWFVLFVCLFLYHNKTINLDLPVFLIILLKLENTNFGRSTETNFYEMFLEQRTLTFWKVSTLFSEWKIP